MITVAETELFQKKVKKLLSAEEREDLISYLSRNSNYDETRDLATDPHRRTQTICSADQAEQIM